MIALLILGLLLSGAGLLILVEGVVIPPLFNTFSLAHKTFLKKMYGDEDSVVVFRWFGIALMIVGVLILNYIIKVDGAAVAFYLMGVYLLIGNGKSLFTIEGREWINKQRRAKGLHDDEKVYEFSDSMYIFRGFVLGLIITSLMIYVMYKTLPLSSI